MTSKSPVGDISVVTLIRTDTTLDHSQKAEKVWCLALMADVQNKVDALSANQHDVAAQCLASDNGRHLNKRVGRQRAGDGAGSAGLPGHVAKKLKVDVCSEDIAVPAD